MKRTRIEVVRKPRRRASPKLKGFEMGVRCGATIAKELIKSGWKDLDRLPEEVVSRVTGK
jgi:hypothetical protein